VDQDVEGIVDNARFCGAKVLEKIEVRPSIGTNGHQLSVDDRVIREGLQCGRDKAKPLVQDVLAPRIESCSASTPDGRQPIAVQLDFLGPFRSLGQSGVDLDINECFEQGRGRVYGAIEANKDRNRHLCSSKQEHPPYPKP
jgi:hypothetical protein